MKMILITSLLLSSLTALADSSKLVEQCRPAGVRKIIGMAESSNLQVSEDDIVECGIDNRSLNPYKYVWFCAEATGEAGSIRLSVMTQKGPFKKCF